jgi:hypothetical protein
VPANTGVDFVSVAPSRVGFRGGAVQAPNRLGMLRLGVLRRGGAGPRPARPAPFRGAAAWTLPDDSLCFFYPDGIEP